MSSCRKQGALLILHTRVKFIVSCVSLSCRAKIPFGFSRQQTRISSVPSTDKDMAAYIKVEAEKYFSESTFQDSLREFNSGVVKTVCQDLVERVLSPFRKEFEDLKVQLTDVKLKLNNNEQHSRRESVRIYGVQEEDNKDCPKKGLEFFLWEMGLEIDAGDIDRTHMVGWKRQHGSCAIIVKFKS